MKLVGMNLDFLSCEVYPRNSHDYFSTRLFKEIWNLNIVWIVLAILMVPFSPVIFSIIAVVFVLIGLVMSTGTIWNICSKD